VLTEPVVPRSGRLKTHHPKRRRPAGFLRRQQFRSFSCWFAFLGWMRTRPHGHLMRGHPDRISKSQFYPEIIWCSIKARSWNAPGICSPGLEPANRIPTFQDRPHVLPYDSFFRARRHHSTHRTRWIKMLKWRMTPLYVQLRYIDLLPWMRLSSTMTTATTSRMWI